jgi:hypothetical protein
MVKKMKLKIRFLFKTTKKFFEFFLSLEEIHLNLYKKKKKL